MAGLCERCMTVEARSPSDLYCDACEDVLQRKTERHADAEPTAAALVAPDEQALRDYAAHLVALGYTKGGIARWMEKFPRMYGVSEWYAGYLAGRERATRRDG